MEVQNQIPVQIEVKESSLPPEFEEYVKNKIEKNASGGRPHFLTKKEDPRSELLNIIELVWIKGRSIGSVARKYDTNYTTIYRCLKDLEGPKQQIITHLLTCPRRKIFFNKESETSDYETVQAYVRRAKRQGLKRYKKVVGLALQVWKFLKYKDPANWDADDVLNYLTTKSAGSQFVHLVAIRQVAPQIADKKSLENISTISYKDKIQLHKKDIFQQETILIVKGLEASGLHYHALIIKVHITLGAREGSSLAPNSGMTGLTWDRFKKDFSFVDLYETKIKGGIWCRDCPLTLFWDEIPQDLKDLWIKRGKPITEHLILGGYSELRKIYKEINKTLKEYYKGKLEPSLYNEITTLKPHDSDRIHVNLLWEAGVPLEIVAGMYLGRGEGLGLMGRIWLDTNTLKKHYLSMTQRSKRFQEVRQKVQNYSEAFRG
ncbi:MAG: helix-turn-helix domain containing protein [Candidatus Bathyarchaeota archaeon]|nr:helix-turn-helix domain containing protein [Candidatus Bathyarchaeota archaeon]